MEYQIDNNNNLIWVNYFKDSETTPKSFLAYLKQKFFKPELQGIPTISDSIDIIDSWQSDDIHKFILPNKNDDKLGSHIYKKYFDKKKKLLSEHIGKTFNLHVAFDKENRKIPLGLVLTSYDEYTNRDYLEYIVTNPQYLKSGIGTKMLKSMSEDPTIFSKEPKQGLATFIRTDNIASINLFRKFGFNPQVFEQDETVFENTNNKKYIPFVSLDFFESSKSKNTTISM